MSSRWFASDDSVGLYRRQEVACGIPALSPIHPLINLLFNRCRQLVNVRLMLISMVDHSS